MRDFPRRVYFRAAITVVFGLCLGRAAFAQALEPASGDRVKPDLTGMVSTLSGVPLTNATIFIYSAGPRSGLGGYCPTCYLDCRKSTRSGPSGEFKIEGLSPDLLFQVLVVAPGCAPTFFNRVDPFKEPLVAKVDARPANLPVERTISGRVIGLDRKPLTDAFVSVEGTRMGDTTHGYPPKGTEPLAVTDERGEFSIRSLTEFDAMNLRVRVRGYAPANFSEVRPGRKLVEFAVAEGAMLTGRLEFEGRPLKGMLVGVVGRDRSPENFTGDFVTETSASGGFLFVNLPPGREYDLYGLTETFQKFGTLPARSVWVGQDGSETNVGTIKVTRGFTVAGQVKLSNREPIPPGSLLSWGRERAWDTTIAGVELPPDGRFEITHVPGEVISLRAKVKGYRLSARNASLNPVSPYELVGRLVADTTNLIVLMEPGPNLPPDYSFMNPDEQPENFALGGAETKRVMLNAVTVSGRAVDAETKAPLTEFEVIPGFPQELRSDWIRWDQAHPTTGSSGEFSITFSIPAETRPRLGGNPAFADKRRFVLMARADGYLPAQSAPLHSGQTNWEFQLHKGKGPEGTLLRPDGKPAAGATLIYLAAGQPAALGRDGKLLSVMNGSPRTSTDADGRFTFQPQLGSGEIIAATPEGFAQAPAEELVKNGILKLQPWTRIRGRLVREGKPLAGESVDLGHPRGNEFGPVRPVLNLPGTVTDDDGRFRMEFVPPMELNLNTRVYFEGEVKVWISEAQHRFTAQPGAEMDLGEIEKSNPSERKVGGFRLH